MIYDRLANTAIYGRPGSRLDKALSWLRYLKEAPPDGRVEIEGERLFASVSSYSTARREEKRFEAHRKYIDVQMLFEGEEAIDVSLEDALSPLEAYNPEKDVVFLAAPPVFASLVMQPGQVAVFYPQDAHRPGCRLDACRPVRKIVLKVEIE